MKIKEEEELAFHNPYYAPSYREWLIFLIENYKKGVAKGKRILMGKKEEKEENRTVRDDDKQLYA